MTRFNWSFELDICVPFRGPLAETRLQVVKRSKEMLATWEKIVKQNASL